MAGPQRRQRKDAQKSLVGFIVGGVRYAVEIAFVREIVLPGELTPLPHTPPEVAGVFDHRGEVVPLVDLRRRFGLPEEAAGRSAKWILVAVGGRTLGLAVDGVTEVFGTDEAWVRPTPELGGDAERRGIAWVASQDGRLVFVLDLFRLAPLADVAALAEPRPEAP